MNKKKLNIGLINLGCPKNTVDAECMLSTLDNFVLVNSPEKADFIIINTCGFLKKARDESEKAIKDMLYVRQKNKKLKIIVAGCFVEKEKEKLIKKYRDVYAWVGVNDFTQLNEIIKKGGEFLKASPFIYSAKDRRALLNGISAYVKIAEGCNKKCSFCLIPQIKGKYRSRKIEDIVKEIKILIDSGVKEINLISQDTSYYGVDIYNKKALIDLVQEILKNIKKFFWLRIMYLYPDVSIIKGLIDIMEKDKRVCKYFDIPIQHINDNILKSMKRGYTKKYVLKMLKLIKSKIPEAVIRSTFIVGYPDEGEKEFNELLNFVKMGLIDKVGIFKYSDEKGTESYLLKMKNDKDIINKRNKILILASKKICDYNNKRSINRTLKCLIIGKKSEKILFGRTEGNAPDIDEYIEIENTDGLKPGDFCEIKINSIINRK